jgi:hypothetical protein
MMKVKQKNRNFNELYLLSTVLWVMYCSCCLVSEMASDNLSPLNDEALEIYLNSDDCKSLKSSYFDRQC